MNKIIILLISLMLLCGCSTKEEQEQEEEKIKTQLERYAPIIFIENEWHHGGIKEGVYKVNAKEMKKELKLDISLLEKYKCNLETTRIEMVVKKQIEPNKTNYEYRYVIDCKF